MTENKTALILTIGLATEPSIKRINHLKPHLVYFIHSKKSKENALFIIEETGISNYKFKELDDHESVDDAFIKSLDCINELEEANYEVIGDFTVGTKPMVAGLVMACIEKNIEYKYLGESSEDARVDGMGPVKSGFEKTKDQENPYENYAINEFKSGKEFFDKYQFTAARENFIKAESKLKYCDLKKRSKLFIKIVDFYDSWDKFNDEQKFVKESNIVGFAGTTEFIKLNNVLEGILNDIKADENLLNYFKNEIPNFYKQMKNNKLFLDRKISSSDDIYKNIPYYLPDLLNNAKRRIKEGKYDDAVARLYRTLELIAQLCLYKFKFLDKDELNKNKSFSVRRDSVEKRANKTELAALENGLYKWKGNSKLIDLDLSSSYKLLKIMSEYRDDNITEFIKPIVKNYDRIRDNFKKRNRSILAHGLMPLSENEANSLFNLTKKHAVLYSKNIENNMKFAEFPLFENDE